MFVTLDFETYFDDDYSLRKMTTTEYVRHRMFKIHNMGLKLNGNGALAVPGTSVRTAVGPIDWSTATLVGHNLRFDGLILSHHFGVVPKRYVDTLGMSRALIGNVVRHHGLGHIAEYLDLTGGKYLKGEDGMSEALSDIKGVRNPTEAQMRQLNNYVAYAPNSDVNMTWDVFNALRPRFPENEYDVLDWTVRMMTQPALEMDIPRLRAHAKETRRRKLEACVEAGYERSIFTSNDKFAALLKIHNVDPPMKKSPTTGKPTYAFAKNDLEFSQMAFRHEDAFVRKLVETRLLVKSSIEETRAEKLADVAETGNIPIPLNYSGAMQTHRLSGADGVNVQNFARGGEIRKSIIAPEGHHCVVADLSNIELRVAIALANDDTRLQMVRDGEDLYCHTASSLFSRPVFPDDHPQYEPHMYDDRQVGKVADLSLQFGAGRVAFQGMLHSMAGVIWSEDDCQGVVKGWRETHVPVTSRWQALTRALKQMVNGVVPDNWAINSAGGEPVFWFTENSMRLPRGLEVTYPGIKEVQVYSEEHNRPSKQTMFIDKRGANGMAKVYGGLAFENIVQALAANIYVEQAVLIDRHVAPVKMSVHDEAVLVVPDEAVDRVMAQVKMIMSRPPQWWSGLPLNCSVDAHKIYGEAK